MDPFSTLFRFVHRQAPYAFPLAVVLTGLLAWWSGPLGIALYGLSCLVFLVILGWPCE